MKPHAILAALLAVSLAAACGGNEPKKDDNPAPTAAASQAEPAPPPAPAAKPECPAAPAKTTPKKKGSKTTKATKADAVPPVDCEPARPKDAKAAAPAPAAAEPETPKAAATGKACNPCTVKAKDGSFDGEVYGNIPANSKWAKLQIGMHQSEVERILGVSHNVRAYVTGKAFIPFYFGSDRHRYEIVYPGQGSVAYTGGTFGGGMGVLMMINYDSKVQ